MGFPCALSNVEFYTGREYGSSTVPTSADVSEYITDRANEIRMVLRKHDIDESGLSGNATGFLESLNARGAAADAEKSSYRDSESLPDNVKGMSDYFDKWIKRLADSPGYLDADSDTTAHFRSRFTTGVTAADADDTPSEGDQNAVFRKGDDW